MKLIEANVIYRDAFLDMAREYVKSKNPRESKYTKALSDFMGYIEKIERYKDIKNLPEGRAPGMEFWLLDDFGRILGTSRLRFYLVPQLENEGGHIGYDVRPSERNLGYGTEILRLTLEKAKARNITPILVTCDEDNVASIRVIEKNGGRLVGNAISEITGKSVLHYNF